MGKAQSKRSVDITTESKKGGEEEVTGKLEKIEDVDQKQVNGDASPQEQQNDTEKKDTDESENDKDLTTEKSAVDVTTAPADGENVDQKNTTATAAAESPKDASSKDAAAAVVEEISPLADESIKKSKKEKGKRKWSFRNISFGKKDKQKPAKTEETVEAAAATNGEAEKSASSEATDEVSKKDETSVGDVAAGASNSIESENIKNGNASDKELNGQKTPTPTEEKPLTTDNAANETATKATATTEAVLASAPTSSNNETAIENQHENKAAINLNELAGTAATITTTAATILSNGSDETVKNGIETNASIVAESQELTTTTEVVENNKINIPIVINNDGIIDGEKPHQNGTNGEDAAAPEIEAEQCKSHIEETAKDLKEIAAAAEIKIQDLPVTCE